MEVFTYLLQKRAVLAQEGEKLVTSTSERLKDKICCLIIYLR